MRLDASRWVAIALNSARRQLRPRPTTPADPEGISVADDKPEGSEGINRRIRRSALAKRNASTLPTEIDNPFYADLLKRWPVAPTLASPVSQICTAAQFEEKSYLQVCRIMQVPPALQRKQWEFAFIIRSLEHAGML